MRGAAGGHQQKIGVASPQRLTVNCEARELLMRAGRLLGDAFEDAGIHRHPRYCSSEAPVSDCLLDIRRQEIVEALRGPY